MFALYYGVRPPLEGMLYLNAAIGLGAFLLQIYAVVIFLFFWVFFASLFGL
jgi:hypothetical protein